MSLFLGFIFILFTAFVVCAMIKPSIVGVKHWYIAWLVTLPLQGVVGWMIIYFIMWLNSPIGS